MLGFLPTCMRNRIAMFVDCMALAFAILMMEFYKVGMLLVLNSNR